MGSPPPMRGKVLRLTEIQLRHRITPAYAGKRRYAGGYISRDRDHPRLCGEKDSRLLRRNDLIGSPPPMRGKVFKSCCIILSSRITPAYAGKSAPEKEAPYADQDHPRLCGEKSVPPQNHLPLVGSPPPMRGKVLDI